MALKKSGNSKGKKKSEDKVSEEVELTYSSDIDIDALDVSFSEEEEVEKAYQESDKPNDPLKRFIFDNEKVFRKYKRHLKNNSWAEKNGDEKYSDYEIELTLIKSVIDRLKVFVKRYSKFIKGSTEARDFITLSLSVIRAYNTRIDYYLSVHDWESYDDKKTELKFQDRLFSDKSDIDDKLEAMSLEGENKAGVVFHAGQLSTLPLHELLIEQIPEILDYPSVKQVDWNRKPKDEMFILMDKKDIPVYNVNLHYFEQTPEVLQFYIDEYNKFKHGITIDGVHISPWLYFHLNFFKTTLPFNKSEEKIMTPILRDNEWLINKDYLRAETTNKILFIAAARRIAKSTFMASRLHWKSVVIDRSELLVVSGSSKDLGQILKNYQKSAESVHPAFYLGIQSGADFKDKVILGIKRNAQTTVKKATLNIINLKQGQPLSSELLAGYTPHEFLLDEALKFSFREALEGIKPALASSEGGWRVSPCIACTGGNEDLSRDGLALLKNPEANDILLTDWEELERAVPPGEVTWNRIPFGTFLPAQMSLHPDGIKKLESNLAEYLGFPEKKNLAKIKMYVTDWKHANEVIRDARKKKQKDAEALLKEKVYYPIDPEEISLSGKTNPYPVVGIKKWRDELVNLYGTGKHVELYKKGDGKIGYSLSNKELAKFPHTGGGFVDSPIVLYVDELPTNPPDNLYVLSLDDYKQEQSDTDSVGSAHVYKRNSILDENAETIVASFATRPDPKRDWHRQLLLLMEAFNAKCFMENEDMEFKTYLDPLHLTDKWLVPGADLAAQYSLNYTEKRTYGWTPTPKNKRQLIGMTIHYTKEEVYVEDALTGEKKLIEGYRRIKDVGLLDEMLSYNERGNFDRITSFGGCLAYANYLDSTYQMPKVSPNRAIYSKDVEPNKRKDKPVKKLGLYTSRRQSPF